MGVGVGLDWLVFLGLVEWLGRVIEVWMIGGRRRGGEERRGGGSRDGMNVRGEGSSRYRMRLRILS